MCRSTDQDSPPETLPLHVNADAHEWDRLVKELTDKGLTVKAIAGQAKLTKAQVAYRQRRFGVSAMDYRRGYSPAAKEAIAAIRKMVGELHLLSRRDRAYVRRDRVAME